MPRHNSRIEHRGRVFRIDNLRDREYCYLIDESGKPVARETKKTIGKRFRQGTNPDCEGFDAFSVDFKPAYSAGYDDAWHSWSDATTKNTLVRPAFLDSLVRT